MIDTLLVAEKTVVNAKGDGPAVDVSASANRVFLLTLDITNIIEQESSNSAFSVRPMVHSGMRSRWFLIRRSFIAESIRSSSISRGIPK